MADESSEVPLFVTLTDSDPDLRKAISLAKRTLHQFLRARTDGQFLNATYSVKVAFIDRSKTCEHALLATAEAAAKCPESPICHIWLVVHSLLDDLVFCHVAEAPKELALAAGTSFAVTDTSIEDWMVNDGGTIYGGFSLRVARERLSMDDKTRFDFHTGIREFKSLNI